MSQSITFKFLKYIGFNLSEGEYGNISLLKAAKRGIAGVFKAIALKYCMYSVILAPLNYRLIRPYLWRKIGAKVGKGVFIGYDVWMDYTNSELIEVGDGAHITTRCIILCHQRDLSSYALGNDSTKLPYLKKKVSIGNNVMIGMGSIIMPGVTIGEGSIIGANSTVTRDIPPWSIATGSPAKVVKKVQ